MKHGNDIYTVALIDGSVFTGECTLRYANGDSYSGDYVNDLPEGNGTFTWASGEKYIGEFQGGLFNGKGTYTFADGSFLTDTFVNGDIPKKAEDTVPEADSETESDKPEVQQ